MYFSYDVALVNEYHHKILNAVDTSANKDGNQWTFPCNANIPNLQIRFGKSAQNIATIMGEHFNGRSAPAKGMCSSRFTSFQGRNTGAPILMSNFVAFQFPPTSRSRVVKPSIGIAPKSKPTGT